MMLEILTHIEGILTVLFLVLFLHVLFKSDSIFVMLMLTFLFFRFINTPTITKLELKQQEQNFILKCKDAGYSEKYCEFEYFKFKETLYGSKEQNTKTKN